MAELLEGGWRRARPGDHKTKEGSHTLFPVSLQRCSIKDKIICAAGGISEGDLNKCISTVACLHSVDLKP